jgi:hypothetical protein
LIFRKSHLPAADFVNGLEPRNEEAGNVARHV